MKEKIKIISTVLLVIITIGAFGYFSYQYFKRGTLEGDNKTEKTESQKELITKELAEKYNALIDWNKNISYTIQLQNSIVKSDRPILFTGYIDDIFKEDEQYFIRFATDFLTTPEIRFVLECDYDKISKIIDKEDVSLLKSFSNYVVVADVDEIKKMNLQIIGYPEGVEEIALEYAPADIYIATGHCVDFIYIGDIFDIE